MQDQAFLGPESGLAVPAEDGGVELYVATQWLHVDQKQICAALGLPPEKVRLTLVRVGGGHRGRAGALAARVARKSGARRHGPLVYVKAEIHLDGGAYASSTPAVVGNAGTMGIGPYVVPSVQVDAYGAYTNNPPCGAMRGFGSGQTA